MIITKLLLTHSVVVSTKWHYYGLTPKCMQLFWCSLLQLGKNLVLNLLSKKHSKPLHTWDNPRGPTRGKHQWVGVPVATVVPLHTTHSSAVRPAAELRQTDSLPHCIFKGQQMQKTKVRNKQGKYSTLIVNKWGYSSTCLIQYYLQFWVNRIQKIWLQISIRENLQFQNIPVVVVNKISFLFN